MQILLAVSFTVMVPYYMFEFMELFGLFEKKVEFWIPCKERLLQQFDANISEENLNLYN